MIYLLSANGLPVSVKAHLSGRSRSSFYYRPKKPKKDQVRLDQILLIHKEHPFYGYRSIAIALKLNHKAVHRLMKRHGIRSKYARRRRGKNQYSKLKTSLPNLMKDMEIEEPNCV